jgi:hypothetical protein
VQFYTDDAVLLDGLAVLFGGSLAKGRSVASIMMSSHRSGLERRLLAQGVDVREAIQNGRLCILDADQALSEFMEPAGPNRERFLLQFEVYCAGCKLLLWRSAVGLLYSVKWLPCYGRRMRSMLLFGSRSCG